jgi:heme o synthase
LTVTIHAATTTAAPLAARRVVADYISLTKPRIIELLLITTVPAMIVAAGGWPGLGLVAATVAGGALVSGSAHATNMVYDRDIDAAMERTATRPLPSGRISVAGASVFAAALLAAGAGLLYGVAGALAAALTVAAWAHYVVVYTVWLKRRSDQNIVIGGAAGALPPVIGWAAVTGTAPAPAWALFAVVVLWTPTHFWALAIGTGEDYEHAAVPMLNVVRGVDAAARHGLVYALATVAASLALPLLGIGGWPFALVAGTLGAWFVTRSLRLVREPTPAVAWRLFHASIVYLAVLFVAVGVTVLWS